MLSWPDVTGQAGPSRWRDSGCVFCIYLLFCFLCVCLSLNYSSPAFLLKICSDAILCLSSLPSHSLQMWLCPSVSAFGDSSCPCTGREAGSVLRVISRPESGTTVWAVLFSLAADSPQEEMSGVPRGSFPSWFW